MSYRLLSSLDSACLGFIAGGSSMLASFIVDLPEASKLEAIGKIPLVIALGAVCCFCVWIIYKQGADFRKSLDKLTDSNNAIARLLEQRPCIRPRSND